MNKTIINGKIAIYCGWSYIVLSSGVLWHNPKYGPSSGCPNYCDSLDNMRAAEELLTDSQYDTYLQELALIVGYNVNEHADEWPNVGLRKVVSASAYQRAQAFCTTLQLRL